MGSRPRHFRNFKSNKDDRELEAWFDCNGHKWTEGPCHSDPDACHYSSDRRKRRTLVVWATRRQSSLLQSKMTLLDRLLRVVGAMQHEQQLSRLGSSCLCPR